MTDIRGQLLQAKAAGRYCSGCAFDRFLWLVEQEALSPSAQARAARGWLDEFEGRFAPEDKAQLGGKCKICRRPRASALRIRRALGLN
jgi:hypothetical protein